MRECWRRFYAPEALDHALASNPALRERFRDPVAPPFAHPFHHAAFVLLGEEA